MGAIANQIEQIGSGSSIRETTTGLAQDEPRQSAARQHSGDWADHRYGNRIHGGRPKCLSLRAGVRRLAGLGAAAEFTGGKIRLGGITKRGNRYLRRLLINGASANLLRSRATKADPWVIGLPRRRPPLV